MCGEGPGGPRVESPGVASQCTCLKCVPVVYVSVVSVGGMGSVVLSRSVYRQMVCICKVSSRGRGGVSELTSDARSYVNWVVSYAFIGLARRSSISQRSSLCLQVACSYILGSNVAR